MSGGNPESWHPLFRREEQQAIAREDLGLGSAAVEDTPAFAAAAHGHVPGDITGLDDYLSSVVGGLLVEGSGIDLTQDSISGAITIAATGGGAGGVAVRDEGATLTGSAGFLDFVGAGVAATTVTGGVQVSVPGASGGSAEGRTHVVPALTDFTWVNQGTATATQRSYGIGMTQPSSGGNATAMLVRSTPSTPYTIRVRLKATQNGADYVTYGLVWRNSSSGLLHFARMLWNGGYIRVSLTNFSSPTNPVAETMSSVIMAPIPDWFRLTDNGTDRSLSVSSNGDDWVTMWSGARTTYVTPDQVGLAINNQGGSKDAVMSVLSWEVA